MMNKVVKTKEEMLAHLKKVLEDQRKVKEYLEEKRTLESLEKEGIFLTKLR